MLLSCCMLWHSHLHGACEGQWQADRCSLALYLAVLTVFPALLHPWHCQVHRVQIFVLQRCEPCMMIVALECLECQRVT